MRHRPIAIALAALSLGGSSAAAQAALTPVVAHPGPPTARSVTVDYHMARARDQRHAGRFKEALVSLDSALHAEPRAVGAHPMRALILAEQGAFPGALAALRRAHAVRDSLAFPAALQIGNNQYRMATISRLPADFALALPTLMLADSIAPSSERRAVARLLVAGTALSLANAGLPAGSDIATCASIGGAVGYLVLARTNLQGAEGAPAPQLAQLRGALEQLAKYADAHARRLSCG